MADRVDKRAILSLIATFEQEGRPYNAQSLRSALGGGSLAVIQHLMDDWEIGIQPQIRKQDPAKTSANVPSPVQKTAIFAGVPSTLQKSAQKSAVSADVPSSLQNSATSLLSEAFHAGACSRDHEVRTLTDALEEAQAILQTAKARAKSAIEAAATAHHAAGAAAQRAESATQALTLAESRLSAAESEIIRLSQAVTSRDGALAALSRQIEEERSAAIAASERATRAEASLSDLQATLQTD